MQNEKFTDVEVAFLASLKEETALDWAEITEKFNKKFKKDKSLESVKKGYQRNRDRLNDPNNYVKLLRDTARTRKANSHNSKDNKTILELWEEREDILDAVQGAAKDVSKLSFSRATTVVKKSNKAKKGMTLELLLSDIHIGKKTDQFNLEIAKRRLKQVADTTIKEIHRASEHYKIDKIVLAFLGDMIESATMHGTESSKGCEFGNSRQVQECLTLCFQLIVAPIALIAAKLGAKVECVGVTGNHDRTEEQRTFNNPGEENVTYIIYKTMEEFTKLANLKNVTWAIPVEPYQVIDIYGEKVLYEHYDNVKANTRIALENHLAKRIAQLKIAISFMRGGHFHEEVEYGLGKIQINGNLPGNDGYSTVLGFDCEPCQTLNFYIQRTKGDSIKRKTSFYKRFLIQLD